MRWRHDRHLRRQARDLRERLGDRSTPGSNGHGRGAAWQKPPTRRRWPPRRWLIAIAALVLLGLVPRACVIVMTEARRIADAERFVRELGERRGWSEEELQVRLDSLHRRYRAKPENGR